MAKATDNIVNLIFFFSYLLMIAEASFHKRKKGIQNRTEHNKPGILPSLFLLCALSVLYKQQNKTFISGLNCIICLYFYPDNQGLFNFFQLYLHNHSTDARLKRSPVRHTSSI